MPFACELSWECISTIGLFQLKLNFVRYYPVAGLAFLIFWVWKKKVLPALPYPAGIP
jgi:hypothetical protein